MVVFIENEIYEIDQPGLVDASSRVRNYQVVTPNDFRASSTTQWGSTGQVSFYSETNDRCILINEAWIQMNLQIMNNATGTPTAYPAGSAIALTPDLASSFIDTFMLQWGAETIHDQTDTQFNWRSTLVKSLLDYTYDYASGQQGQTDAFILDAPGQTQNTNASVNLTNYSIGAGQFYYNNAAQTPVTITVAANGTSLVASPIITSTAILNSNGLGWVQGGGGTVAAATVYATASTGVLVLSANAGASNTVLNPQTNFTQLVAGTVEYSFGQSYYASAPTTPVTLTITGGATTITVSSTTAGTHLATNISGQGNSPNTSGFWQRQALTDNGTVLTARIPVRRFCDFARCWRKILLGQRLTLRLFTSSQTPTRMIQANSTVGGSPVVIVSDIQLIIPWVAPATGIQKRLEQVMYSNEKHDFFFETFISQQLGTIQSGTPQFNSPFSFSFDRPKWVGFHWLPVSYINNTANNEYCSLIPAVDSSTGRPVLSAQLYYGGINYPNVNYGSYATDFARIYDTFLRCANREYYTEFSTDITPQQYLQNYFLCVFDLTSRGMDETPSSVTGTINITFANNMPSTSQVYMTVIGERKASFSMIGGHMVYQRESGGQVSYEHQML
jgi:hypothetical protein